MESLALIWCYLFAVSGIIVFAEYSNLYMSQLGFSPSQIGFASLFGAQDLFLPLFGFLGDRFRARKLILIVLLLLLYLTTIAPLLPLTVSLPTCFVKPGEPAVNQSSHAVSTEYFHHSNLDIHSNISTNAPSNSVLFRRNEESGSRLVSPKLEVLQSYAATVKGVKRNTFVPWHSTLFVYMVIIRALFTVVNRALLSLQNLATITYLKERRASYGSYFMWSHIGGSVSLFAVGLLASHFTISICGVIGHGYYITFLWASTAIMLSSFAVPWFKYEYLEHRVISWTEVKCVFTDIHYVCMLILALFIGSCTAFQIYWEFWYISEISGGPILMGVVGLIRRPLVALWFYLSGHLIEKVGDLKTIAVALVLYSVSFMTISFINIPWLVLFIDLFQAAGYGFSYTALNVHFSKTGSKSSSAVILGKKSTSMFLLLTFVALNATK